MRNIWPAVILRMAMDPDTVMELQISMDSQTSMDS